MKSRRRELGVREQKKEYLWQPFFVALTPHFWILLFWFERKGEMEAVISYKRVAPYRTSADVLRLVRQFENCTLPRREWTHQAHLVVALWYLMRFEEARATRLIRVGIRRYNEASGIKQTTTGGYHETLTLFYIRIIRKFLSTVRPDCTLTMLVMSLINVCGDKNLPLEYYSRERLMSWEARTRWLEPDLKALP